MWGLVSFDATVKVIHRTTRVMCGVSAFVMQSDCLCHWRPLCHVPYQWKIKLCHVMYLRQPMIQPASWIVSWIGTNSNGLGRPVLWIGTTSNGLGRPVLWHRTICCHGLGRPVMDLWHRLGRPLSWIGTTSHGLGRPVLWIGTTCVME